MRPSRVLSLYFISLLLLTPQARSEESFQYFGDKARAGESAPELRLKRIFVLPGQDDINGALAPELDRAVLNHIETSSRFELVRNPEVVRALRMEERGYSRVANSEAVHAKAAQVTGADATVVLESNHTGSDIQIRQDWRRADGSLLFTETRNVPASASAVEQRAVVTNMTQAIESRIPFAGSVTGVDGRTITLDLNKDYVNVGERIDLVRLKATKRHPLLKTLVDAEYIKVGTGEITSVDPVLSFARIISISPGEQIDQNTKVARINTNYQRSEPVGRIQSPETAPTTTAPPMEDPFVVHGSPSVDPILQTEDARLSLQNERFIGRYGFVGVNFNLGNLSHSQTQSTNTIDVSGWGVGAAILGEAWITKEWIVGLSYDFISAGLSGANTAGTEVKADGTSWNRFRFLAGYRYLLEDSLEKMFLTFSLGYQSINMNLPVDSTNQFAKSNFSGLLLDVRLDAPLTERTSIVASLGLNPFGSFSATGLALGSTDGSTSVSVAVGYHVRWKKQFWLHVDLLFDSSSASYTTGINLTDRRFSISPGLIYRF